MATTWLPLAAALGGTMPHPYLASLANLVPAPASSLAPAATSGTRRWSDLVPLYLSHPFFFLIHGKRPSLGWIIHEVPAVSRGHGAQHG
ncbi:hypothetical protein BDA96_02G435500 [Sorghum bicolor]|uniref:Uncharacterized protein n=1 Tax=Sorghum bicolor TaxID=4558 RepID=A0A921UWD4_SORBI|nr:hypothetical protein BDA96_02G435500 [Sorghum bicolor]